MKNNGNSSKKILILFAASILIIALFFFFHKTQNNNVNDNSNIKSEESNKKDGKTSVDSSTSAKDEAKESQASTGNKDTKEQENGQISKDIKTEEGLMVFVKAANFGSTVELNIDSSKFNSSYKYYQFFLGNKPISNVESITRKETTIFPSQEVGSEVSVKLYSEDKKVLKELKINLNEKK